MWPNPQFPTDLVTFTEKILNGELDFFVQWGMYVFLTLQPITSTGTSNTVLKKVPKLDTNRRRRQPEAAI